MVSPKENEPWQFKIINERIVRTWSIICKLKNRKPSYYMAFDQGSFGS